MLTFREFARANRARCVRWHGPNSQPWSGADWSNAMCGEAGEAANVVKKLRRYETGADLGPLDPPQDDLIPMLADEIADVIAYVFLLADYYKIDVAEATASKFNRVSVRQHFPERIAP